MTIKIIGYGWVGKAMHTLFPDAVIHDPEQGYVNEKKTDVVFVCVPTPLKDGKLDCSIVEQVVRDCYSDLIIIRSTVNPGTCEHLTLEHRKDVVYQPEYLGETVSHPLINQKERTFIILGGYEYALNRTIKLYQTVYNANTTFRCTDHKTAEIIKLTENRAIAFKVAQCQELYDACRAAEVDYNTVREAVYGDDPRFNLWWTFVYPDNRGFNSKCLPKDVYAWAAWAESVGINPKLTKNMLKINEGYIHA